jgi:signal transduction histidine kinase
MRSLFLRILLWFGVAMVLATVVSFAIGVIAERQARDLAPPDLIEAFEIYAQTAADTFERDGAAAVGAYLERIEQASGIHAILMDESGKEVSGRTVPTGAQELAQRALEKQSFVNDLSRTLPLNAEVAHSPNGSLYVLVGQDPGPARRPRAARLRRGVFRFTLFALTQRLLPVFLVGGLFCYWLARYLSSPLSKLRRTTQELADGQLTARVHDKLLKRRDEIGHLGRDFNLMASRIESLVEAQRRLLGDISHELRSPLARQGVAVGLARRRAGPEANAALDRIEREAERLNDLIGQLLALSQAETGAGVLEKVPIDLSALVREVAEDADYEARSRERSVQIVQDDPAKIIGVPELVRSAIENVVRNAVRHTESGTQVAVWLRTESVNGNRSAAISVRDHGKGVPEDALEEIFRPFYRVEDDRDRRTGGSGLGLSIAARAVRLHQGTIKASNAEDGGLMVEIRLPVKV